MIDDVFEVILMVLMLIDKVFIDMFVEIWLLLVLMLFILSLIDKVFIDMLVEI